MKEETKHHKKNPKQLDAHEAEREARNTQGEQEQTLDAEIYGRYKVAHSESFGDGSILLAFLSTRFLVGVKGRRRGGWGFGWAGRGGR